MPKYSIGDTVQIRSDFKYIDYQYHMSDLPDVMGWNAVYDMEEFCGKHAKIVSISDFWDSKNPYYQLDIDEEGYCWVDEMFAEEQYKISNLTHLMEFL